MYKNLLYFCLSLLHGGALVRAAPAKQVTSDLLGYSSESAIHTLNHSRSESVGGVYNEDVANNTLGEKEDDSSLPDKLKLDPFYKWETIAHNLHWSDWHPASCVFDNSKSSEVTVEKFTTWVKRGISGTVGLNANVLTDYAASVSITILVEKDEVVELDETVPARGWGQEWMRWKVFQTRQRRQKCHHIVIGSGHECTDDFTYFDTYTAVAGSTERAWHTDKNSINFNDCGPRRG